MNSENNCDQTPLLLAAKNGHKAVVKLLLESDKVDTNTEDDYNQTPLSLAAKNGHKAVVKLLLENLLLDTDTGKIDTDSKNCSDMRLLWEATRQAAQNGHEAIVKLLLESDKVDANWKDSFNNQTPLPWAAENGYETVVKLLLENNKIDINWKEDTYAGSTSAVSRMGHRHGTHA